MLHFTLPFVLLQDAIFYIHLFQVFQDPTIMMQNILQNLRPISMGTYKHENDCKSKYIFIIKNTLYIICTNINKEQTQANAPAIS